MKIGIISDTHDHHEHTLKAVEIFKEQKVGHILHAGDMVSPFTAKAFADVDGAKFTAVFGNNEGEKVLLKQVVEEIGGEIYDYAYTGRIDGRRVLLSHWPDLVEDVAVGGRFDLIVYGHTHEQDIRQVGTSLVVNPGEATDWLSGRSEVVVVDTEDMSFERISLKA